MAKLYYAQDHVDADGTRHEAGEQVELPDETPDQQAALAYLVQAGVVATRAPDSSRAARAQAKQARQAAKDAERVAAAERREAEQAEREAARAAERAEQLAEQAKADEGS